MRTSQLFPISWPFAIVGFQMLDNQIAHGPMFVCVEWNLNDSFDEESDRKQYGEHGY